MNNFNFQVNKNFKHGLTGLNSDLCFENDQEHLHGIYLTKDVHFLYSDGFVYNDPKKSGVLDNKTFTSFNFDGDESLLKNIKEPHVEFVNGISVNAEIEELKNVLTFFDEVLKTFKVSNTFKLELDLVIEEIFSNIVKYGYANDHERTDNESEDKKVNILYTLKENTLRLGIKFIDNGVVFNPLTEISYEPASDAEIGGLGLLIIKNRVDHISYENKNNMNILSLEKIIEQGS